MRRLERAAWAGVVGVVAVQLPYPLVHGTARQVDTLVTVVAMALAATLAAWAGTGVRGAVILVAGVGLLGLAAEIVGVHTGVPFGHYHYSSSLGPAIAGVPLVVPCAWIGMSYPSAVLARRAVRPLGARIAVTAVALAAWDVWLDPQMVAAQRWTYSDLAAHLPGVPAVPLTNFGGWLLVGLVVAAVLVPTMDRDPGPRDRPALALWLWAVLSSLVANVGFFRTPWVALWGALATAVPLALLARRGLKPALP